MDRTPADLQRVAQRRARPEFDPSIGRIVDAIAGGARRDAKRLGTVAQAWTAIVPPEVCARCRLEALDRTILSVVADDAATRFEIDRMIRSGLVGRLQHETRGAISRVRVRVGGR